MNHLTKQVATIATACAMLLATAGCAAPAAQPASAEASSQAEGILLTATNPSRGDMQLDTSFVGSVQPEQLVSVMPKMMGTVKEVHVAVGQAVKKGDLLMTLDDADLLPSLKQAEASYNSAAAQVQQMTGSTYKSQLSGLDAQFDQTFDAYENAKYQLGELEDLQKSLPLVIEALEEKEKTEEGLTDDERIELKQARQTLAGLPAAISKADDGVEMARKYYNNARGSYNAMKVEGQAEMQTVADATLAQAQAGLELAKQQLSNTKVYAPIDGVVESVSVTQLNPVSTSAPSFVISNKAALSVSFSVPSASMKAMEVGGKVTILKGQNSYSGTITEVSTMVSQQTGLFTVKASVDTDNAPDLLTGVMVKVTAPTEKAESAILLAQDSVYYDNGQAYVYLAVDGRAQKTIVETGISNPEQIEIVSGVGDNDLVITSWHPNLIDGALITLAS